ncbi:MAG: hypothetical protein RMK74_06405 [Myxococcales bacterium]|nr:hypothetical protein [Myxococcales bacterium]
MHYDVKREPPIQALEAFEAGTDRDTFRAAAQPYDAQLRDLVKTLQVGYANRRTRNES